MRLLLMGPPGAGKGTQALRLQDTLGVPHISTGDIFRANVAARTELGRTAQEYMDRGEYVPDEVTNDLVAGRLREPDADEGFILDGYPRTPDQVTKLESWLAHGGHQVDAVPCLVVPRDELLSRLRDRGHGRADDAEAVRSHRLEVYERDTAPLLALFESRGLLREVSGVGDPEDICRRLLSAVSSAVRS